jgi:hypothetical protein
LTVTPVKAEEDILRQVLDMLAAAGQAQESAEHHRLVLAHNLLETGFAAHKES